MKLRQTISLAVLAITLCSCSFSNSADYSKAPAQTGGPEQGTWQDEKGTSLYMNSGSFTLTQGGNKTSGTYTVSSGSITLSPTGGSPMTATMAGDSGPITINGEQLKKTD